MKNGVVFVCLLLSLGGHLEGSVGRAVARGVARRATSRIASRTANRVPRALMPQESRAEHQPQFRTTPTFGAPEGQPPAIGEAETKRTAAR